MRILRVSDYRGAVLRAVVDSEPATPWRGGSPFPFQTGSARNEADGSTVLQTDEFIVTAEETGSAKADQEQGIP